ncbi:MAG TPA: glycogen debranching enzyme N-terminal domain-containing protein, partial [Micromonosporaceae bacterium]
MTLFRYGPQVCGSLDAGARREWLLTDGRGGYAMGTASGLRTRRYHGLLVVASGVPARRHVALVSLDPIVVLESGAQVRLATHEWASAVVAPQGHELLASFEVADGLPTWRWRIGDVVLERTVAMRHGEPGVAVVHTLVAGGPVRLVVEPLCTWRDGHGERAAGDLPVEHTGDGFVVAGAYRVRGPAFAPDGEWYRQVWHREEAARGLNASEDLFRPGQFAAHLRAGQRLEISAWAGDREALAADAPPAADVVTAARRRHQELAAPGGDMLTRALRLAADAFIMTTATGPDVVAGYPWFGAWSRDTMIAYPGLFLATGRVDQGRELLRGYARTLSAGMLANTADTGRVEHNTADATLWFLHAVDRHVHHTGDTDLAAELVDALDQVVRHHRAGTRYGIRVDP